MRRLHALAILVEIFVMPPLDPFSCSKINRLMTLRATIGINILNMSMTGYLNSGISMCT